MKKTLKGRIKSILWPFIVVWKVIVPSPIRKVFGVVRHPFVICKMHEKQKLQEMQDIEEAQSLQEVQSMCGIKILIVSHTDSDGGAAIGAMRLLTELRNKGINAWMGVTDKRTDSPYVIIMKKKHSWLWRYVWKKAKTFFRECFHTTNKILHSYNLFSRMDVKKINAFGADVVNLHWVGSDTLSIRDIAQINAPIVWTMHDSWAVCGAEHHPNVAEGDLRYKEHYTRSNRPNSTDGFDLCRWTWERKQKWLSSMNITFVGVSRWESNVQKESSLFAHCTGYTIPNILDKNVFTPMDKAELRCAFGIPLNKKVIGFGAAYELNDPKSNKGGKYLADALQMLKEKSSASEYLIVLFGPTNGKFMKRIGIQCFFTGFISNPAILSCVYNIMDVFVCSSLIENLSFTCMEASSCGVPVVAFDVGGTSDIVESKVTGYLARPYEASDLEHGIEEALRNGEEWGKNAATKIRRDFDNDAIVEKYKEVYNSVLSIRKVNDANL